MGKKQTNSRGSRRSGQGELRDDFYGQLAGGLGIFVFVTGTLGMIKTKLGVPWPVALLLVAGVLVLLGYLAWRIKAFVVTKWASTPSAAAVKAVSHQSSPVSVTGAETALPAPAVHPQLTRVLTRTGAIGRDEVILLDEVRPELLPGIGTQYSFLLPEGRTHEDVAKNLGAIASMFGVTRLHMKLETSRNSEREVRLLKLDEPPFSGFFPPPTRQQVRDFAGIPLGHEVTGDLGGVPTLDKASMMIAGMTQMGKTTLVNGLITCLLIAYGDDFDLYLLDGKLCGMTRFEKIAVTYEASDDPAVMESMLDVLNSRVASRYTEIQNAIRSRRPKPTFKRVFFIVDEFADFFQDDGTQESKDTVQRVEHKTRSLVAKSLESGITSIMLTQRPDNTAIPVKVRDQFQYRVCLYVSSEGSAKVALGDSYFTTVAPIPPMKLNPDVKGQAVLFANGRSTLLRGFNFDDDFVWEVVDEVHDRQERAQAKAIASVPDSPLMQAIALMQNQGVTFMKSMDLGPALGVTESDPAKLGRELKRLLGVAPQQISEGRGYQLADLKRAALADA